MGVVDPGDAEDGDHRFLVDEKHSGRKKPRGTPSGWITWSSPHPRLEESVIPRFKVCFRRRLTHSEAKMAAYSSIEGHGIWPNFYGQLLEGAQDGRARAPERGGQDSWVNGPRGESAGPEEAACDGDDVQGYQ
ncbi:hypothetical protein VUR80DRAFT_5135 [Thermomyces stellatus]